MVATRESASLAEQLLDATIAAEKVPVRQLTIHADRGSSMASKPVALLLADLGVTRTHSRPRGVWLSWSDTRERVLTRSIPLPGRTVWH